jgi:hypothetical protein
VPYFNSYCDIFYFNDWILACRYKLIFFVKFILELVFYLSTLRFCYFFIHKMLFFLIKFSCLRSIGFEKVWFYYDFFWVFWKNFASRVSGPSPEEWAPVRSTRVAVGPRLGPPGRSGHSLVGVKLYYFIIIIFYLILLVFWPLSFFFS